LRSFRERGTLLFVSHDPGSVINFCQTALWLDQGASRMQASAQDVCNSYVEYCAQETYGDAVKIKSIRSDRGDRSAAIEPSSDPDVKISLFDNIANSDGWKSECAAISSVSFTDMCGAPVAVFAGGEKVALTIIAETFSPLDSPIIGFFVKDRLGQSLFGENTFTRTASPPPTREGDVVEAQFVFCLPMLPDGEYSMTVAIADGSPRQNVQHHWLHDAVLIRVASTKLRYGLVGIPFESVDMRIVNRREVEP
nr:Wzt carbohydrate-binding domain-containing protein [Pseudomonadota bacterium]